MSDFRSFKSLHDYDILIDINEISMVTPDGIYSYIILKSGVEVHLKHTYEEVCNILNKTRKALNE